MWTRLMFTERFLALDVADSYSSASQFVLSKTKQMLTCSPLKSFSSNYCQGLFLHNPSQLHTPRGAFLHSPTAPSVLYFLLIWFPSAPLRFLISVLPLILCPVTQGLASLNLHGNASFQFEALIAELEWQQTELRLSESITIPNVAMSLRRVKGTKRSGTWRWEVFSWGYYDMGEKMNQTPESGPCECGSWPAKGTCIRQHTLSTRLTIHPVPFGFGTRWYDLVNICLFN